MIAIAARDKIAGQLMVLAASSIAHGGILTIEAFDRHVGRFENQLRARGGEGIHEVLGDFRLPVHRNAAACQRLEVDSDGAAGKGETDTIVDQAILEHALADLGLDQQINGALLLHAGADAPGYMLGALPL